MLRVEQRHRAADLVGHQHQGLARGTGRGGDHHQALWPQVATHGESGCLGEVAVVGIADKAGLVGVGDVVHHHAANALQAHKGVDLAIDHGGGHTFGLWPFVVAAVVQRVAGVAGIEVGRQDFGNQALDLVAAVKHPVAVGVQNGERAAAKGHQFVDVAVTIDVNAVGQDLQVAIDQGGACAGIGHGLARFTQV